MCLGGDWEVQARYMRGTSQVHARYEPSASHRNTPTWQHAQVPLLRRGGEGEVPDGLVHFAAEGLLQALEGGWPKTRIHSHLRRKWVRREGDDPAFAKVAYDNRRRSVGVGAEDLGVRVGQCDLADMGGGSFVPELEAANSRSLEGHFTSTLMPSRWRVVPSSRLSCARALL